MSEFNLLQNQDFSSSLLRCKNENIMTSSEFKLTIDCRKNRFGDQGLSHQVKEWHWHDADVGIVQANVH